MLLVRQAPQCLDIKMRLRRGARNHQIIRRIQNVRSRQISKEAHRKGLLNERHPQPTVGALSGEHRGGRVRRNARGREGNWRGCPNTMAASAQVTLPRCLARSRASPGVALTWTSAGSLSPRSSALLPKAHAAHNQSAENRTASAPANCHDNRLSPAPMSVGNPWLATHSPFVGPNLFEAMPHDWFHPQPRRIRIATNAVEEQASALTHKGLMLPTTRCNIVALASTQRRVRSGN